MSMLDVTKYGYELVRCYTSYQLENDDVCIVMFDTDSEVPEEISQDLDNELSYHIDCIENEDNDYFSDVEPDEYYHIKTTFKEELKTILGLLRQ